MKAVQHTTWTQSLFAVFYLFCGALPGFAAIGLADATWTRAPHPQPPPSCRSSLRTSIHRGGLTVGPDGALYGYSVQSGETNTWSVFRLDITQSPATLATLYTQAVTDNQAPRGKLLYGSDGAFYGVTADPDQRGGTIFRLIPTATRTAAPSGVGTGADGSLTVSGTYFADSVKTKLTANALPWSTELHVADAAGTLAAAVTVGGVTTDRLSGALNAWVAAAWTPGCGLSSWTAGTAMEYPSPILKNLL